jgi:hypothetical protein
MKKYTCTIKIEAESATEADDIIKALTIIASKLPSSVIAQLADVVGNPIKLKYAKQQLGI